MTCRRAFSLCRFFFENFFFLFLAIYIVFVGLFLYVYRACCSRASTASNGTARHGTAQHNQPCTKHQSKYVPIGARQRKQADKVGESQHVVEHSNEEIEFGLACKNTDMQFLYKNYSQSIITGGVMSDVIPDLFDSISDRMNMHHCPFSASFVRMYFVRACGVGVISWSMELLAFSSRQFAPKIADLSVRFIHSHFVFSFIRILFFRSFAICSLVHSHFVLSFIRNLFFHSFAFCSFIHSHFVLFFLLSQRTS